MLSDSDIIKIIERDVRNSMITKYVGVASFTVLLWDHACSFSDEVEYMWKGKKGLAVYLFFVNRYLIPLSFIVNQTAYFSTWSESSCRHFVRYEGSMTMIGISISAMLLFLRIRALYAGVFLIQAFVIAIFITFIGINSYVLAHGIPVFHPAYPIAHSCTMIVDPKIGRAMTSSTAWIPLVYDSVVASLTIYRTASFVYSKSSKSASELFRVLLWEGLQYYSIICATTLATTILVISADESIRNTTSQLHLCLTVAMVSRITLGLKRFANSPNNRLHVDGALQPPHFYGQGNPERHFLSSISHFISSVSQQAMSFVAPPETTICMPTTQPDLRLGSRIRPLPPIPRIDARAAAAAAPSLENGSYLAMDDLSNAMQVGESRT